MDVALAFGKCLGVSVLVIGVVYVLKVVFQLSPSASRRLTHASMGPVFFLTLGFFEEVHTPLVLDLGWTKRLAAAAVPWLFTIWFVLVGKGVVRDDRSVGLVGREASDLLGGPMWYGVVVGFVVMLLWGDRVFLAVVLCTLCFGDPAASLVGEWAKRTNTFPFPLPWNRQKTFAGSFAHFAASFLTSSILLSTTLLSPSLPACFVLPILLSTLAESLSPGAIDNVTVPATGILSTILLASLVPSLCVTQIIDNRDSIM